MASDARTCPRQHEKTFEEQESALRSQVKVQALDNPLQSTWLCHPSSGFTLGVSLPVLKVGSPYGYKGVAPPRDRSPTGTNYPADVQLGHKRPRNFLDKGLGAEPL